MAERDAEWLPEEKQRKPLRSGWQRFLRLIFALCILWGGVQLLGGVCVNILYFIAGADSLSENEALSVGIIGGADGPTAILVSSPVWTSYIAPVALVAVGIAGLIWMKKCKQV